MTRSSPTGALRAVTLQIRESFWFLPALAGVLAVVVAESLVGVDRAVQASGVQIGFLDALSASGGRSILTTIGSSMLTVAGTSFSITISVLATTSSTYGPRLVRNFMADRANQAVLAAFTATFLYAIVVLRSVHTDVDDGSAFVPVIAVHVAVLVGVLDVGVLVFFIHHIATSVQITSLQKRVQVDLVGAVHEAYRDRDAEHDDAEHDDVVVGDPVAPAPEQGVPVVADRDGYVQSVGWDRLVAWADDTDRLVDLRAMPGDHVIAGDVLVVVHAGSGAGPGPASVVVDERAVAALRGAVTIGTARTPVQDVRFALQQLVEIAVRGLASGSNDPYTAVSALDLSATALVPAWRDAAPVTGYRGDAGRVRLTVHWPPLEELVDSLYEGVVVYGAEHPIVLRSALHLAGRLDAVAPPDRRGHLDEVVAGLRARLAAAVPE
ncbi:DUF2254 domain-containing protein [Curtobacterium sp. MCLR17_036]|uniref:DUF2254 domain-containing protein n=1 Tax=Curtobacterium sp. MCLR17_036 TaxID=2175620 RepID=UPI000DA9B289|nr:DUF2254 domain-containing protein [Curtobacterium sp. MCLR17_036]WIE64859.1 DUF2254 domain-containing protein [Curtobacterium sp. MCLR17_036]